MNKIDEMIKRVRELDAAATPGPWEFDGEAGIRRVSMRIWEYMTSEVAELEPFPGRNVTLITEYRTLAPKLAAMLERVLEALRLVDLDRIEICDHGTCICGVVEEIEAMAE